MKKSILLFIIILIWGAIINAQFIAPAPRLFNRQDSLRGSITPERSWWDLTYYHLDIRVNPGDSTIYGSNIINYKVLKSADIMQIDLQEPLTILKAEQNGRELGFRREGNVFWISISDIQVPGRNLKPFFDQYLRDIRIPLFEYYIKDDKLTFRWNNCVAGFNMPLMVYVSGEAIKLEPVTRFTTIDLGVNNASVFTDPNYYVGTLNITGK
jgi:hypothetical protein